jgi:protein-disulfide isomerase
MRDEAETLQRKQRHFPLTAGAALLLGLAGCRSPESLPKDIPPFDPSVDPDAGVEPPGEACAADFQYDFNNDFSPYFGGEASVDAEVSHFSSFYCIHCADFAAKSEALWERRPELKARARIYFHHMNYGYRHRAAVAAANQGEEHFWALHDYIFDRMLDGGNPSKKEIRNFVREDLALDMARFDADAEDKQTYSYLLWDIDQGLAAGVVVTPTVFVCGQALPSRGYLESAVDDYL